jgi:predicted DNA-binding transcriptional regulator AlpA
MTTETENHQPQILTKREAAQLARISERTLDRLSEDGRGPARIALSDRRVGFSRQAVLAWLASRTSPDKRAA